MVTEKCVGKCWSPGILNEIAAKATPTFIRNILSTQVQRKQQSDQLPSDFPLILKSTKRKAKTMLVVFTKAIVKSKK